jgi:hypothetical protein
MLLLALTACDGGSPTQLPIEREPELGVTRVGLTLELPFEPPQTAFIDDPDGTGPRPQSAQVGTLVLQRNVPYTGSLTFENRTPTPIVNLTNQVQTEASRHRIFFTVTGTGVVVEPSDVDPQGFTLGLRLRANTGAAPTAGTLGVVLCRYAATSKPALASACVGTIGATETNVTFSYTIRP